VGLLLGAQLVISRRVLRTLIVKPENMLRNLDRSGGVVLSEGLMMALAPALGRDTAHSLILRLSRLALRSGRPFREVVGDSPEVRSHLTPRRLEKVLDYRSSLGLAGHFVDEVVEAHRSQKRRRRHGRR
jgi:adenylosuccinate lyase